MTHACTGRTLRYQEEGLMVPTDREDTRTQEEKAQDDLEVRWEAAGKPTGQFRALRRVCAAMPGAWELACVDERGEVIPGVRTRRFRPTEDETCTLPLFPSAPEEARA